MPKQTILATVRSRILGVSGPGPIYTCHQLSATERRDGAGTFRAEFPATDSMLARVKVKEVYLEFTVGGKFFYMGLVERIVRVMDRKGRQTLIITGRDQLGALAENSVGSLEVEWAYDAPTQILGASNVPNQTFTLSADGVSVTAYPFTKKFFGETALQALVMLSEDIGEHFRAPKGPSLEVVWLGTGTADAPVRLVAAGGPRLHENPDVAIIEQVESDQNGERLVNRVYPYGAGFGDARLTLEHATMAVPVGFTMNTAQNYIQHDGQQALPLLLMAQHKTWNHIGVELGQVYTIQMDAAALTGATLLVVETVAAPIATGTLLDLNGLGVNFVELSANAGVGSTALSVVATTFDIAGTDTFVYVPPEAETAAANQLAYAALQHLQRLSDPDRMVAYKLTVRGLPDDVAVGQRIPVLAQAPGFAIDDDLIILEITRTVSAAGRMPAVLRVVPVDWFDVSDAGTVATAIEQLENMQRQGQPVDYAQVSNAPTQVDAATADTPLAADKFGFWDVVDAALKSVTWTNLLAAIHSAAHALTNKTIDSTNIASLTAKNPPVDADSVVIVDSAAANVFKAVTWVNIKATLKAYFDTLYGLLASANTWTAVNTFSSGIAFANETITVYDEDTYLPVLSGSVSDPTITYTTRSGSYRRINKRIDLRAHIRIATISGGSGNMRISLPIAVRATSPIGQNGAALTVRSATGVTVRSASSHVSAGSSLASIYESAAIVTIADLRAGDDLYINISYDVD